MVEWVLFDVVLSSPELKLLSHDQTSMKWQVSKLDHAGAEQCIFGIDVTNDTWGSDLHFAPLNAAQEPKFAEAVAHMIRILVEFNHRPKPRELEPWLPYDPMEPTEAQLERVATFLQRKSLSLHEIIIGLGLPEIIVVPCLARLMEKGIVGRTPPGVEPRMYFLK